MTQARALLTGKWGMVAVVTLVYLLVCCAASLVAQHVPFIGWIVPIAIGGPMALGFSAYMLSFVRGGTPELPVIFSGFNQFVNALCLYLLIVVITLVGFVLLIVPGIIAAIALSMSWFIMLDNPKMGVVDIATASYNMTQGNKWKLFCLMLRFIGWLLLGIVTFGIGLLFVIPYMQVAYIKFYEEIKTAPAAEQAHIS